MKFDNSLYVGFTKAKESDRGGGDFDSEKFGDWKNFWSAKILDPRKMSEKILGLKEFKAQKILGSKIF